MRVECHHPFENMFIALAYRFIAHSSLTDRVSMGNQSPTREVAQALNAVSPTYQQSRIVFSLNFIALTITLIHHEVISTNERIPLHHICS